MSAAQRTGLSIVLGVILGWLVFSAIPHPPFAWFGWLGIPIGGLFAWLVVDLKKVGHAISTTWCQMRSVKVDPEVARERWWMIRLGFKAWLSLSGSFAVFIFGAVALFASMGLQSWARNLPIGFWMTFWLSVIIFVICILMGILGRRPSEPLGRWERHDDSAEVHLRLFCFLNPYVVYIQGLVWEVIIKRFLWRLMIGIIILRFPVYMSWFGRFLWRVYVMLHERRRTIALVVTVLVTTALYFIKLTTHSLPFWTLPVGAVVGYLLGLTEYEVVAKRWLHVVPANGS